MTLDPRVLDRVRAQVVADGRVPTTGDVARALRADGVLLAADDLLGEARRLHSELMGVGPLAVLLRDPEVTDVLVTAPGDVWVDRGRGVERVDVRFADDAAVRRLAQRLASDKLSHSLSLDTLPEGEPGRRFDIEPTSSGTLRIDEYLRAEHPLLSEREKLIIARRFCLRDTETMPTLEKVGHELGLSKERVRQVQASALTKLRKALVHMAPKPA